MPRRSRLHVLTHLWLELTRELSAIHGLRMRAHFGRNAIDLLISSAVYLGMVENRDMTSTKLAHFIGLPRATVIRHLSALAARGIVERRGVAWRIPLRELSRRERQDLHQLAQLLRRHDEDIHS